jgi:hypothetical protein
VRHSLWWLTECNFLLECGGYSVCVVVESSNLIGLPIELYCLLLRCFGQGFSWCLRSHQDSMTCFKLKFVCSVIYYCESKQDVMLALVLAIINILRYMWVVSWFNAKLNPIYMNFWYVYIWTFRRESHLESRFTIMNPDSL